MSQTATATHTRRGIWRSIGPAIIVASVVLGPGSILISSRVGVQFGYSMLWMLLGASILMMGTMALGARLGATLKATPCDEIARRFGRGASILIGVTVFLIVALFQSSNNIAVLSALELLIPADEGRGVMSGWGGVIALVLLNAVIIATLFGFKRLYHPIERLMMILVMIMLVAFVANLIAAGPPILEMLAGLVPHLPVEARRQLVPYRGDGGAVVDPWWPIQGLLGTTLSVAGAFYQAYLVREKGWGLEQVRRGTVDSMVGIAILGGISMMIMVTAGTVLHGRIEASELKTVDDVARQLEPAFGQWAKVLFSTGLFAAAFSSFFINAAVGGTVLSDSLKLGSSIDARWPKLLTTLALLVGMVLALFSAGLAHVIGGQSVDVIIYAQALTVLGLPLLAIAMLYLARRSRLQTGRSTPLWMLIIALIASAAAVALAFRTAWRVYLLMTAQAA
jgi:manganese transport protein